MTRRRAALGLLTAALLPKAFAAPGAGALLPMARSLTAELEQALAARQPLVVMVSLDGCPWCRIVRENYLRPLRAAGKLPVVQVDIASAAPLQDFAGRATTHDALTRAWNVDTAPTLLFFGRQAREVAPRLVGVGSPDFYGAYLDDRIRVARAVIAEKG